MIKECKKCGGKNLFLEPRIKGQAVLTTDMVALKCKDCGSWLKWCPKDERKFYLNKQPVDKWQKLKEWVEKERKNTAQLDDVFEKGINTAYCSIKEKMQELEVDDE